MDLKHFFEQFQDYLAPKLDTYEQAIYLYIFRHSRFVGKDEIVIGFKSARARLACGVGEKGKPMSENTAYEKLQSLKAKNCIEIVSSEHTGRRIRLKLPNEIPGVITEPEKAALVVDVEEMDFFSLPEHSLLIFEREKHKCFYCLSSLTAENRTIDHIISGHPRNNRYRNLVAACRDCNNRKNKSDVEDFLRKLYRESFLNASELQNRLEKLNQLRKGELKPVLWAI